MVASSCMILSHCEGRTYVLMIRQGSEYILTLPSANHHALHQSLMYMFPKNVILSWLDSATVLNLQHCLNTVYVVCGAFRNPKQLLCTFAARQNNVVTLEGSKVCYGIAWVQLDTLVPLICEEGSAFHDCVFVQNRPWPVKTCEPSWPGTENCFLSPSAARVLSSL